MNSSSIHNKKYHVLKPNFAQCQQIDGGYCREEAYPGLRPEFLRLKLPAVASGRLWHLTKAELSCEAGVVGLPCFPISRRFLTYAGGESQRAGTTAM